MPTNYNTWYGLGYHNALYNTQIRWYYTASYYYYSTAGTNFYYPNTYNQSIAITVGGKSTELGLEKEPLELDFNSANELKPFKEPKKSFDKVPGSIDFFPVNQ